MSEEWSFLKELRSENVDSVADALVGIHRAKEARDRLTECLPPPLKNLPPGAPPLGDAIFQLARLQLRHVRDLLRLNNQYADQVFTWLRGAAGVGQARVVALRGPAGGVARPAEAPSVQNCCRSAVEISFVPGRVRARDGRQGPDGVVTCAANPPRIEVGARSEIDLRVDLTDSFFKAGECYFADIDVRMRGETTDTFALEIQVDAAK